MPGDGAGFCAAAHTQLAIDTADLCLHRIEGDDQFLSNLCIGAPGDEQAEHAALLWAQRLKWRSSNGNTVLSTSRTARGFRSTNLLREGGVALFLLEGREQARDGRDGDGLVRRSE